MEDQSRAAFFRLEGTLTDRSTTSVAAWMAAHAQEFSDRLSRLGAVALSTPFRRVLRDAETATRLSWSGVRGLSADRLHLLGEEHFELFYRGKFSDTGRDFLQTAKREGLTPVLISDSIVEVVNPVAEHFGIEHVICNRLEMRNGNASGRLLSPICTGRISGQLLREMAVDHQWDLLQCRGYGSQETDITLLSALGHPCTVQPDRSLRAIAKDLDWPIVEATA